MKFLLDTHIMIWALENNERLPDAAKEILGNDDNAIFYSVVSVWEIAIKHKKNPNSIMMDGKRFSDACSRAGYHMMPLIGRHVYSLETIERAEGAPPHKDPFDRILIAQAKSEGFKFVTHDKLLSYYGEDCIMLV